MNILICIVILLLSVGRRRTANENALQRHIISALSI